MSALCQYTDCGWEGTSTQVVDARCPRCGEKIVYESKPLVDTSIKTLAQFNRRAVAALKTCALNEWDTGFVKSLVFQVEHYEVLAENVQRNLLRAVMRHGRAIIDRPVVTYAEMHAPRLTA